MTIPEPEDYAQAAAIEICKRMGLEEIQVIGKKNFASCRRHLFRVERESSFFLLKR